MAVLAKFIDMIRRENLDVKYVQVTQHRKLIDSYYAMPTQTRLNAMSVAKSFVAIGVGIAIDDGLMSLDDKLCESFPEYITDKTDKRALNITVKDLLSMTSGLKKPLFFSDSPERYIVKDWIRYFFDAEFAYEPGTHWLYSNFNTYMLANLLERKTKVPNALYYLREKLLEPIGITNPDWTLCPMGHIYAANGLYLTIDEMTKFGQFLLDKGMVNGKQLVSSEFVQEATSKYCDSTLKIGGGETTMENGYGYQFWMTRFPGCYASIGSYGQMIFVSPKDDTVITAMSLEYRWGRIMDLIPEIILELR